MLIDATQPEETRVAVVSGNRLEEYDFETASKKQLKGNIYLAKVVRVEPSLQAAFVEYGGNRHGFLAFSEIHPDYYRIPVEDRAALIAEEREMAHDEERMDAMGLDAEASSAAVGRPATRHETGGSAVSQILPSEGAEAGADDAGAAEEAGTGAAAPESGEHDFIEHDGGDGAPEHEAGDHETEEPAFAAEPEANQEAAAEPEGGEGETAPEAPRDGAPEDVSEAQPEAPQQVTTAESVENVGGEEVEVEVPRRRHPSRRYKIQEVIKRRQVMLVQVTKEERGTKGAALTTRLSLAGRYCVLMPNTGRGGGISRKITNIQDRKRLREIVDAIEIPEGISVIVRTAGAKRTKAEIKRDFDYLLRLWSDIRDRTLQSSAPALIYEEANLIKRSIRDLYARDMDDILVEGEEGYKLAKEFMRTLMPSHAKRVQPYRSPTVPLFQKFQIESQIAAIHEPLTRLKSGGYIVINQTEALVAIDVNSGRATRERNIEETATQTNLEASDEIARQLRMRDLAGLIVIDFIDMEHERNRRSVEKRLKDALKNDRARIQLGHISHFGLLEMSRQRLRPSLHEFSTERCPHCQGSGVVRSTESTALQVLRAVEEEGLKRRSAEIAVFAPPKVALYILNQKRPMLTGIESRHLFHVLINQDEALVPPDFRIEVMRTRTPAEIAAAEAAAREAPEPEFAPEPE
ncbi:MAG TPA: Rne/Rng family ribonuclease, partial [Alphaproteobacteria bacterium]|nr:Rne/Rng family ribonuclease [Alphaproteobacteria bacterium]